MKLLSTFILFVFIICFKSFSQGVINGNFESWSNKIFFEDPALMSTSNIEMMMYGGPALVTKSTDAAVGKYSIHMKSEKVGNDTAFGYFIYGKAGNNLTGGIPYTDRPDSIKMKIKYHTPGTADIVVVLLFKKNGLPLTNQIFSIMGKQTKWTDTSFAIDPMLTQPDSVIFGIATCNPFTEQYHPGNWVMVDSVFFIGTNLQMPNNDFETWNTYQNEEPLGWNSFNLYYLLNSKQPTVTKSSDAHSGNSSISVKTAAFTLFGASLDTVGIATTGKVSMSGYSGGFPLNAKPDSMTFWYKYNNSAMVTDMAAVYAEFKKYNSTKNKSEVIDSAFALLPGSYQWKKTTVKFNSSSPVPDTCNMVLASSALIFGPGGIGNQLLVDDILFFYKGVGLPYENLIKNKFNIFPNPASSNLYLMTNDISSDIKINILNSEGKIISNTLLNSNQMDNNIQSIDIQNLPSGLYFVNIYQSNETHTLRFIKQ